VIRDFLLLHSRADRTRDLAHPKRESYH